MDVVSLHKEVVDIQQTAPRRKEERGDHHRRLFDVFRNIEAALAENGSSDFPEAEEKAGNLLETQTIVLRTAATLPARTARDLLYKLAMWRWDASDVDKPLEELSRADAVAYSAFRDLAVMLDDTSVLKDFDHSN